MRKPASPKPKIEPPPAPAPPPRGRPLGARNTTATPFSAKIYAAVTMEQKERPELIAVQRRHKEHRPPRWGVSDLVRELIETYLQDRKEE